ncbi:MAG TPA: NAD(P)-dependent oxidoreductase [Solirubrobacteraceae bacterium]|nr:NAD(P)-dependent oxidoreductase [Solirubrobacteraceae bacterium]
MADDADTATLSGRTMLMSGGSRGIGLAIALRAARDGANIALLAKTAEPHPRLEGTIYTAAEQIEQAGGRALPIVGDVRDEDSIIAAVSQTVEQFGGIDFVLNNASAIDLSPSTDLATKRFDLMQQIEVRGTFLLTRTAIPHLRRSDHAHILTLSPPLNLSDRWLGSCVGYMLAKYGMTLAARGFAAELASDGIASNTLWPRTIIATAAVQNLLGGEEAMARSRRPEIMGDAAHAVLSRPPRECTGRELIDDEVLAEVGITDLSPYGYGDGADLQPDIFLD